MTEEQTRLRATFDQAGWLYDEARPGYPEALFDDVVAVSGIPPGGRILEIGCGTGQAILPWPSAAIASSASNWVQTWPTWLATASGPIRN